MIDAIVAAVGGSIVNTRGVPCEDAEGHPWTPRKLKFWFEAGKTMSIPVPSKTNLVATANTIATQLNRIARVICVSLEGETWSNIIDIIDPTSSLLPPVPMAITDTPAGTKEPSYVGSMAYETDGVLEMSSKAFKMATNLPGNAPYAAYATAINECLISGGPLNTSRTRCPGFRQLTFHHRRFRVVMLQNRRVVAPSDATPSQAISEVTTARSAMLVPMSARTPELIRACGLALRAVPHTMCLGYRGEWDKRFSLKNPGALPAPTP